MGERISEEDARLVALTGSDLVAAARTYLSKPTVVGHLSPNEAPPRGNSQKSSAAASDDFSKRIPNGPIVMPSWIAKSINAPTTAHSVLAPVEFTLSNGVHVIVQRKTDRSTFVLRGKIASSPAFEPAGQEGIIRLASSVADYGSAQYPFAQRRKATDDMGAEVQTGQSFSAQGEARDFERIVAIIADGEAHPTFADPWFGIERSQLANSLQSEGNISGVMIDRAYNRLLLASDDPSLRQPTAQSVSQITQQDLLSFSARYWRPDLTTIAVAGDLSPDQVRTNLEAAFGSWQASRYQARPALNGDSAGNQRPRLYRHRRPTKSLSVSASRRSRARTKTIIASSCSIRFSAGAELSSRACGRSCARNAGSSTASAARSTPTRIAGISASS